MNRPVSLLVEGAKHRRVPSLVRGKKWGTVRFAPDSVTDSMNLFDRRSVQPHFFAAPECCSLAAVLRSSRADQILPAVVDLHNAAGLMRL